METHETAEILNQNKGLNIPPWVWAVAASLAIQIAGAIYVTGRVSAQIDSVADRVGRLERQYDDFNTSQRYERGK